MVLCLTNYEISYFNIIAAAWPQQAFVRGANTKIHVSYVKCDHNHSSEQLARHSEVTLELVRKIKRYRAFNVVADSLR